MLAGNYTPGPVITARLRVFVNGVERPHISASWTGNISGGLPESLVAGGDDVYSRTGSITWAPDTAVQDSPFAPVGEGRWKPRHGDKVQAVAEVDGVNFPRFTGYITRSTFSLTDNTVTSDLTDGLGEALEEVVTIPPQVAGAGDYARSAWVAYRAIEQAGLGALPPIRSGTVAHASLQYGTLAAVGRSETVKGAEYGEGSAPGFSSWSGIRVNAMSTTRDGRDVIVYSRATSHMRSSVVGATFDSGRAVSLTFNQIDRRYQLRDSRLGLLWSGEATEEIENPVLAFKVGVAGTRVWTSRTDSVRLDNYRVNNHERVVLASGEWIGGVQVEYLDDWTDSFARVAGIREYLPDIERSALELERVPALRGYENVKARTVVEDWCKATLGSVWINEKGQLRMVARDRMAAKSPRITDYADERLFTGAWSTARDGVRAGVLLKGIEAHKEGDGIAYQPEHRIELEADTDKEIFYTYPDEVDVIGLRTNWRPVVEAKKGTFNWDAFNRDRRGSWWSIGFDNDPFVDSGEEEGIRWTGDHHTVEDLHARVEQLGQRTLKFTFKVDRRGGSREIKKYVLQTPSIATGLWYSNREQPMPLMRAETVVTWTEYTTEERRLDNGPLWELETSWWLTQEDARRVAKALADELAQESITLDRVAMLWDPRKQIGDAHTLRVRDQAGDRWELVYLVTGYSEDWDGNVPACSYDMDAVRVHDLREGKTYRDLQAAYKTYRDFKGTYSAVQWALPAAVKERS